MFAKDWLHYVYLAHFAHPAGDRELYRYVRRHRCRRILEIGVGTAQRSLRLIRLAQALAGTAAVRYTGIDLYEARSPEHGPGLTLKQAHCLFKETGAVVQLAPGDPHVALARVANGLPDTELVVISAPLAREHLERAWFYVPRTLAPRSTVFLASSLAPLPISTDVWQRLAPNQVAELVPPASRRRAA